MKKQVLLSLITTGTIVATSAMSFAAWDQLSDTTGAVNVTYTNPVIVSIVDKLPQTLVLGDETSVNGGKNSADATFTVKTDDIAVDGTNTVTLKTVDNGGVDLTTTGIKVNYYKGTGESATLVANGVDTVTKEELTTGVTYTARVQLDTSSAASEEEIATFTKSFHVKATLAHTN